MELQPARKATHKFQPHVTPLYRLDYKKSYFAKQFYLDFNSVPAVTLQTFIFTTIVNVSCNRKFEQQLNPQSYSITLSN